MATLLLDQGAAVDAKANKGRTPLHYGSLTILTATPIPDSEP